MEQAQPHPVLPGDVAQAALGQMDLPLGRGDAGVLVRVGVAEHDLLHVTARGDQAPVRGSAEQLVEDDVRRLQFGDGLQQRHEADSSGSCDGIDEPRLAREHHRGQHVVRTLRHRHDARFDRARTEGVQRVADGGERLVRDGAVRVERWRRGCERARGLQLAAQQCQPLVAGQRPIVDALRASEQLRDDVLVLPGVLANVQGGQWQADGAHHANGPIEQAGGGEFAAVLDEIGSDEQEVVEQFTGRAVVPSRLMRGA